MGQLGVQSTLPHSEDAAGIPQPASPTNPLPTGSALNMRKDATSITGVTYYGFAPPKSSEFNPVWQVMRITAATEAIDYAGTGAFDQVWANRTILGY